MQSHMRRSAVVMLAMFKLASSPAYGAGLITETLQNATFYDGGIATGSFIFDTRSNVITSFSISVSGGDVATFPPFTYSPLNSNDFGLGVGELGLPVTDFRLFLKVGNKRGFGILLEFSLPLLGGTVPFHIWPDGEAQHASGRECVDCCFGCSPFRNFSSGSLVGTIPEPATVALVGLGLLALALRYFKHA